LRKTQSKGASIRRVDVTISDVIAETSEK